MPTPSNSTAWCLFCLAQDQALQDRLRTELRELDTDSPSMDVLMAAPLLDKVVRETLRLHSVVAATPREAACDDVVPLKTPIRARDGTMLSEIRQVHPALTACAYG